jgi:flagellar assembly protein FliH
MALIKQTQAERLTSDAIVLDLGDLQRQADQLKEQATQRAAQIIAEARVEAQKLAEGAEQRGFEQGRAAGYEQGLEEGRQTGHQEAMRQTADQLQQLQQAWQNALQDWQSSRNDLMLDAQQNLLSLSLAMARRIVHRLPQVDPQVIADQLLAAIEYVVRPSDIVVRIHPDDRGVVDEALPALMQSVAPITHASIVEDPSIARGGCEVRYGHGRIDATLDQQLDQLVEAFLPEGDGRYPPDDSPRPSDDEPSSS